MGVPNSASLANTPTTSYPVYNPTGIWLYGDIRKTMDGDVGNHENSPNKTSPDTNILSSGSAPETRLSRLAGYNNTTPDRGQIVWNRNKLPARSSATQEVRMGDFQNFTTTVFKSSSISLVDNFSSTKVTPSASVFDFTSLGSIWRNQQNANDVGYLYNIAYIDNANDPRLGVLFVSSSNVGGVKDISQTGSRYDWDLYDWDVSSNAIDTNATIVCVDQGCFGQVNNFPNPNFDNNNTRVGMFYWQNGASTKMVPYEFNSASGAPGALTIHSSAEATPSTTYGAQILKAASTTPFPFFTDTNATYAASSLLVYNGYSSLRARLFSISGSKAQLGNNPGIEIFSGSEFVILNSSPGKRDKCYTSVLGSVGSSTPVFEILYGDNYNSSLDGDDKVYITQLQLSQSTIPNNDTTFRNDPDYYLDLESNFNNTLFTSSASQKYGAKSLVRLQGASSNQPPYLAIVAKSNNKIDVKYIREHAQGYAVSSSLTNVIGDSGGVGLVQHQLPVGGVSLGTYTEYSASIAIDSNSYSGSKVEYVAISYTAQAPSFPPGPKFPVTSIIKIYHKTGDIIFNSTGNNVLNYEAAYETVNSWGIPMLPQMSGFNLSYGYQSLFSQEYINTSGGDIDYRGPYYMIPMIFHYNWAGGFRMSKNYLSIY